MTNLNKPETPIHVMFLCWGYSIHAERNVRVFSEDPHFRVSIVSTYNYAFSHTKNILLTTANSIPLRQDNQKRIDKNRIKNILRRAGILRLVTTLIKPFRWIIDLFTSFAIAATDLRILQQTVAQDRPDIIFLQTLLYPSYLAYFLPKSIPQIVTFWNGDVTWWAKWNGIERLLKKRIVIYGVQRATAITVNSLTAYRAVLDYGVEARKVYLNGYGDANLDEFRPIDQQLARRKLGLRAKSVILWPRGLGGYLNSDVFVHALAKVVQHNSDLIALMLSGASSPDELAKHQQLAQKLGISDKLIWVGQVDPKEMPWYYASANMMVSISSNDSRPNVMLEAMACGIPVIMGDIPQIREWIRDGENGYLVPTRNVDYLAKAITRALDPNNQALNQTYVKNSQQLIHNRINRQRDIFLIKQLVNQIVQNNKLPQ